MQGIQAINKSKYAWYMNIYKQKEKLKKKKKEQ